jgi:hypothetical protein
MSVSPCAAAHIHNGYYRAIAPDFVFLIAHDTHPLTS